MSIVLTHRRCLKICWYRNMLSWTAPRPASIGSHLEVRRYGLWACLSRGADVAGGPGTSVNIPARRQRTPPHTCASPNASCPYPCPSLRNRRDDGGTRKGMQRPKAFEMWCFVGRFGQGTAGRSAATFGARGRKGISVAMQWRFRCRIYSSQSHWRFVELRIPAGTDGGGRGVVGRRQRGRAKNRERGDGVGMMVWLAVGFPVLRILD